MHDHGMAHIIQQQKYTLVSFVQEDVDKKI